MTRCLFHSTLRITAAFIIILGSCVSSHGEEPPGELFDQVDTLLDQAFEALLDHESTRAEGILADLRATVDSATRTRALMTQLAEADMLLAVISYERDGMGGRTLFHFYRSSTAFQTAWSSDPADDPPPLEDLMVLKRTLDRLKRVPRDRLSRLPKSALQYLARAANDAGILFMDRQLVESRQCFEVSLLLRDVLTEGRPDNETVAVLDNLSVLLRRSGYLHQSFEFSRQAILIAGTLDASPNDLATRHNNRGTLYASLSDHALAVHEYTSALNLLDRSDTKLNEDAMSLRISLLGNLALCYNDMHRHEEALEIQRRVVSELDLVGDPQAKMALALQNLGAILADSGRLEEAVSYLERSLLLKQAIFTTDRFPSGHPSVARTMHVLAETYLRSGKFPEANEYSKQSLEVRLSLLNSDPSPRLDLELSDSWVLVARLMIHEKKYPEALKALVEAVKICRRQFDYFVTAATIEDSLVQAVRLQEIRDQAIAMIDSDVSIEEIYQIVWETKSNVYQMLRNRNMLWGRSGNENTNLLKRRLLEVTQELVRSGSGHASSGAETGPLKELRGRQRELLLALSNRLGDAVLRRSSSFSDLALLLPHGMAFVDIVLRTSDQSDLLQPRSQYVAFILQQNEVSPKVVVLGDALIIDDRIREFLSMVAARDAKVDSFGATLREAVWTPVVQSMAEVSLPSHVVISGDGLLGSLPWDALPAEEGEGYLLENFTFSFAVHGQQLAEQLSTGAKAGEIIPIRTTVVGEVEFTCTGLGGQEYPTLPESAVECDRLCRLVVACGGVIIDDMRRGRTQPRAVLEAMQMATIAHLSTHLFAEAVDDIVRPHRGVLSEHSLEKCGIVLTSSDDGSGCFLYGSELAAAELSNTWLVVLAGCYGGQEGRAVGENGLAALDHAVLLAGAGAAIASSWEVDDLVASFFVDRFYHELFAGQVADPVHALRKAKLSIYRNGPGSATRHPFYWANWRLSGDPTGRMLEGWNKPPSPARAVSVRDELASGESRSRSWWRVVLAGFVGMAGIWMFALHASGLRNIQS
jgi:CHAT domain-containing protein/tetratricopeptide (TPR) repeat protein